MKREWVKINGALLLCAGLLAGVWFAADAVYLRYVAVPETGDRRPQAGRDVLSLLNEELERVLQEKVRRAEEERRRLEERVEAGILPEGGEEGVRRQLEELERQEKALREELRRAEEERTALAAGAAGVETAAAAVTAREPGVRSAELQERLDAMERRWETLQELFRAALAGEEPGSIPEQLGELEELEAYRLPAEYLRRAAAREERLLQQVQRKERELQALEGATDSASERSRALQRELRLREERLQSLEISLDRREAQLMQLQRELAERRSALGEFRSLTAGLFQAAEAEGVFYDGGEGLAVAVNPQRREEILRQGTFFVHPPGEPETISTRVLILEEGGELFYRRYPGQPEPREGQWF